MAKKTIDEAIDSLESLAKSLEEITNEFKEDEVKRKIKCLAFFEETKQMIDWLKDYKRLLAKENGIDIRCGTCKHDGVGDGVCDDCNESYHSKWEYDDNV